MNKLTRECVAEAIGTFALVFAGTGAIIINDISRGAVTNTGIGLTFGLIVMVMIYALGDISGAHINPAVTIGFCLARNFPFRKAGAYILSQISGGLLASAVLRFIFPGHLLLGITQPKFFAYQSAILEFFLTFLLMFVILNVTRGTQEKGFTVGAAVGATVGLEAILAGPISGASMNPARSLAPAVVSGYYDYLWIYLFFPVFGAITACFCAKFMEDGQCQ